MSVKESFHCRKKGFIFENPTGYQEGFEDKQLTVNGPFYCFTKGVRVLDKVSFDSDITCYGPDNRTCPGIKGTKYVSDTLDFQNLLQSEFGNLSFEEIVDKCSW